MTPAGESDSLNVALQRARPRGRRVPVRSPA